MKCRKCPHHVRHGQVSEDKQSFAFKDLCGLKVKQTTPTEPSKQGRGRGRPAQPAVKIPLAEGETLDCIHFPFESEFDYFFCNVYQVRFKSKGLKNGVVPTKDIQYSDTFSSESITEMEFL